MAQYHKRKRFRPELTVYHNTSKILPALLEDIVRCYQKGYKVCKYCYYRKTLAHTLTKSPDGYFCSSCSTLCQTALLIPASHFCENFGNFKEVPIPPTPKWSLDKRDKPFSTCSRSSHFGCFEMSATSDVWFAHTIEELVIWTVEREYDCSFQEYIDQYHYGNKKPSNKKPAKSKVGKALISKGQDLDDFNDLDEVLDPNDVMFDSIEDIPENLLENVLDNYKKAEKCCRYCFYYKTQVNKDKEERTGESVRCRSCKRRWNPIKVIGASKFCMNFGNFKSVPISVPANTSQEYPHEYCNRSDHYRCFEKYAENGFKYAHSIEELVVWTVEREIGYGNFAKYVKGQKTRKNTKADIDTVPKPFKYVPGGNKFATINSIPHELLSSICDCYERRLNTCRACYYDSLQDGRYNTRPTLSSKEEGSNMCERGHYWKPVRVIPASDICESYGAYIGIPPFPHHMNKSRAPFQICNYKDHNACYEKMREINPWFPHTVEEVVVWTVERETSRDFSTVYRDYISRATPKKSQPLPPSSSRSPIANRVQEFDNVINKERSPELNVAIETLVEGVQDLVLREHSPVPGNSTSNQYENQSVQQSRFGTTSSPSPLLFVDDESDEDVNAVEKRGVSGLNEKKEITLSEASYYFPALAKTRGGSVTADDLIASSRPTDVNPYLTQVPSAQYPVPHQMPVVQPLPPTFPSVGTVLPLSLNAITHNDNGGGVSLSEDEDEVVYECYLCYREFESAERLANHSTKRSHIDIMKKDFHYGEIWKFHPYPPDQGPEDFTICTRSANCPGRLKCCSAHSLEEKEEWMLRYHHRNKRTIGYSGNTPTEVISRCNKGMVAALSPDMHKLVKIGVKPAVQQTCADKAPKWKLTIKGQGWQTLLGVMCADTDTNEKQQLMGQFKVSAIKGDTIYTLRPKSNAWIASSFEDGILLGCIVLIIRGVSLPVGSHYCRVKLHFGLQNYLYIDLQAVVNY